MIRRTTDLDNILVTVLLGLINTGHVYAERVGQTINPGFVIGQVQVIRSPDEYQNIVWDNQKIYVLPSTPPHIRPIGGVLTKGSGSTISHVQLLCRNLGIPNADISETEFEMLLQLDGRRVLFATQRNDSGLLKLEDALTEQDLALYRSYKDEDRIEPITLNPIDNSVTTLIDLKYVRAEHAGRIAGPKAANLGTLKDIFSDRVVDGFIIPFAVVKQLFNSHDVDQLLVLLKSSPDQEIPQRLAEIRERISQIIFPDELQTEILRYTKMLLDANHGAGVFIRSDTNVEDLAKFSGAGLNLTVPNITDLSLVMSAIRAVWSSPWSDRAYSWRKNFITNPESILPSVLIMQSVDSFKAGVLVSKDLTNDDPEGMFISVAEGLGFKVVNGNETSEEWLVSSPSSGLPLAQRLQLQTAGSAKWKYVLDNVNGGVKVVPVEIDPDLEEILKIQEVEQLEEIAIKVRETFNNQNQKVWDIEFGILRSGKVVLFQNRPFTENMNDRKVAILHELFNVNP